MVDVLELEDDIVIISRPSLVLVTVSGALSTSCTSAVATSVCAPGNEKRGKEGRNSGNEVRVD